MLDSGRRRLGLVPSLELRGPLQSVDLTPLCPPSRVPVFALSRGPRK